MPAFHVRAKHLVSVGALAFLLQSSVLAQSARAEVSAEEAKQLGTTLTEFGAEKAGNADGSIPAYTGGLASVPGYDPQKADRYIDPFASDKPLYSITPANMGQYEAVLAPGSKTLLETFDGYRIDVYPSHRSVRYTPVVLANSVKNATTATLAGAVLGDSVAGADARNLPYEGVPFPIPKSGYEVMWNHLLRFAAAVNRFTGNARMVDSAGNSSLIAMAETYWLHSWYDTKGKMRADTFDAVYGHTSVVSAPPKAAGAGYLGYYPIDMSSGQKAWFYTPGQRRIRPAPDFSYDMLMSGSIYWDELGGFVGRMDRFDYQLAGKKELLVPYNTFAITNTVPTKDFLGEKYINPDALRWEKHRVWVVNAIRKQGAKHAFSKRTYYVDEDSWCILQVDAYDDAGKLVRVQLSNTFPSYATGGINNVSWTSYDLKQNTYYSFNAGQADTGSVIRDYDTADGLKLQLTPQSIVGASIQ